METTLNERVTGVLRELAQSAAALPRCESEARRARVTEAYGQLASQLVESDPELDQALVRALDDPDAGVRAEALKAISRRRRPDAAGPVAGALADPDEQVRVEAARALQRLAGPSAAADLARVATDDASARVRCEALRALLRLDRARALDLVAAGPAAPEHTPEAGVDVEASALAAARARFDAVRRRWGQAAVRQLVPLLGHPSAAVRRGAAAALGHTESPDAALPLVAALSDASITVRLESARSLGALGDPRAVGPLSGALHDPDHLVRGFAAEALGRLGMRAAGVSVLAPLAAALVDPAVSVRQHALTALGRIAERQRQRGWACSLLERQLVVDAIAVGLSDPEPALIIAAAKIAGAVQDPRLIRPMLGALRHPDAYRGVQEPVVVALRRLGQAAEAPVLRALHDADPRLRARVALLLGVLPFPGGAAALMELLGDSAPPVRAAAAAALGELRERRALGLLLVSLRDPDPDVCARAAQALGRLGDARAVPALMRIARDLAARTRGEARRLERSVFTVLSSTLEALGGLRDGRALEPLVLALGHGDWRVRRDAADALGALGDARASEALSAALLDDERLVRRGAAVALRLLDRRAA